MKTLQCGMHAIFKTGVLAGLVLVAACSGSPRELAPLVNAPLREGLQAIPTDGRIVVRRGDGIYAIAARYGLPPSQIVRLNSITLWGKPVPARPHQRSARAFRNSCRAEAFTSRGTRFFRTRHGAGTGEGTRRFNPKCSNSHFKTIGQGTGSIERRDTRSQSKAAKGNHRTVGW